MSDAAPLSESAWLGSAVPLAWSRSPMPSRRPMGFAMGVAEAVARPRQLIDDATEGHLMTIAPTGAGKGVGCVIPALLSYAGPVVVIDPKGENAQVTAGFRRRLGHRVVLLDPFGQVVLGEEDGIEKGSFNPFDLIARGDPAGFDDAMAMAEILLPSETNRVDPFWDDRARQLIAALILYVAEESPEALRNPAEVAWLLNQDKNGIDFTGKDMMRSANAVVQQSAAQLLQPEAKVRASIISVAQRSIDFLRSSCVAAATHASSFAIDDIVGGKPVSLYLVLPPDKLASHAPLLRLWIGSLLTAIVRRRHRPPVPTLFLLDEAAQLGTLEPLRVALTLLRGYGVRTWTFWQDLSQLQALYPTDWKSLLNNCRVVQAFGLSNRAMVREMTELLGWEGSNKLLGSTDRLLLQQAGHATRLVDRLDYRRIPALAARAGANRFYESAQAPSPCIGPRAAIRRRSSPSALLAAEVALTRIARGSTVSERAIIEGMLQTLRQQAGPAPEQARPLASTEPVGA